MPYRRTVRYASPLVDWHDLELVGPAPDWSDVYRAQTPRVLVPGSRWIEAEQRGERFVCDALTPLVVSPEVPYRMRQPFVGQRSVVIVFGGADDPATLGRRTRTVTPRLRFGPAAHRLLMRCRAAVAQGVPDRLGFEEALVSLVGPDDDPGDRGHRSPGSVAAARSVERARELLAGDPASGASLHEIARAVAASPYHLARCFKRATGVGLHGYRTRLRMALAMTRLAECGCDHDLTRLALDLGYSSHSHFSAAFRVHFGVVPSRARRLLTPGLAAGARARFR